MIEESIEKFAMNANPVSYATPAVHKLDESDFYLKIPWSMRILSQSIVINL